MNILLVAPNMSNINSVPEIRTITATHRTHVLNGNVTIQDIYSAVTNSSFDVLHFATHMEDDTSTLDEILVSNGERLDLIGATRIAKLGHVKLVMFNVCMASRFAAYMVRNKIPCIIYTTVAIEDRIAWELPAAFYEECRRAENGNRPVDFKEIFESVDSGDGRYAILVGTEYFATLIQTAILPMWDAVNKLKQQTEKLISDVELLATSRDRLEDKDRKRIAVAIWLFITACIVVILCGVFWIWLMLNGLR